MEIKDRVYGKVIIKELVLIELINSKPLQRLKGINQAGAPQYAIEGRTVTRYEHSVGVMILLKKLGASVEEQIAGVLHDVAHTVFSHMIDFVFKDKNHKHEFHEKLHKEIIMNSEVPRILDKFGFDVNKILDENNFPLLERKLPDLCADRVDYTLRDMTAIEGFSEKTNEYVSSLIVHNNEIMFADKNVAKKFAEEYLRMDEEVWAHPLAMALFQILADAIRIALDEKILSEKDLFEDDSFVYNKLKASKNELILKKLNMLNPNLKIIDDPKDYDFHLRTKLRYIDPKFLNPDKSINRVTDKFDDFSVKLKEHEKWIEKGNFTKIVSF